MIVALTNAELGAWWGTVGLLLVVAGVVWFLLEWLRRTVKGIDAAVNEVWTMGKRVAQNTATTHTLTATKARGTELVEELGRHAELVEGKGE